MERYEVLGNRDCLIFPIGCYDDPTFNRSNAEQDAKLLKSTFEKLSFNCQEKRQKAAQKTLKVVDNKNFECTIYQTEFFHNISITF